MFLQSECATARMIRETGTQVNEVTLKEMLLSTRLEKVVFEQLVVEIEYESLNVIPRLGETFLGPGRTRSKREGTPVIGQNRVSEPEGG